MYTKLNNHFKNLDIIMHIAWRGLGIKAPFPTSSYYMKVFKLNLLSILEIKFFFITYPQEKKKVQFSMWNLLLQMRQLVH